MITMMAIISLSHIGKINHKVFDFAHYIVDTHSNSDPLAAARPNVDDDKSLARGRKKEDKRGMKVIQIIFILLISFRTAAGCDTK